MGVQKNIPNIKPGDWTSVRQVVARLASRIGPVSRPTFAGLTLTDLTAVRLTATDSSKQLTSENLADWIAGTANQIIVTDDGDGTITLSTPQDIATSSSPQFVLLTLTTGLQLDGYIFGDSESGNVPLVLGDNAGASYLDIQDSDNSTVAYIDSNGGISSALFAADINGVLYVNADGEIDADDDVLSWNGSLLNVAGTITSTGFTIGANTLTASEFGYLDGQDQAVKTTSSPRFSQPTVSTLTFDFTNQDVLFTNRAGYFLAVQGQASGQQISFDLFTKDGDGTDNANMVMWAKGLPTDVTNREFLQYGYITGATPYFKLNADAGGTGTVRPLYLYTGSGNLGTQVNLLANGDVLMPGTYSDTVGATNRDLYIDDTGKLGYVSSSVKYKTNIRDLESTERIYNLRPRMFDRVDGSSKDEAGLIAEEVEPIMPDIISYERIPIMGKKKSDVPGINKLEDYIIGWETTNEPETVNYSRLIIPLLKEIQILKQRLDAFIGARI